MPTWCHLGPLNGRIRHRFQSRNEPKCHLSNFQNLTGAFKFFHFLIELCHMVCHIIHVGFPRDDISNAKSDIRYRYLTQFCSKNVSLCHFSLQGKSLLLSMFRVEQSQKTMNLSKTCHILRCFVSVICVVLQRTNQRDCAKCHRENERLRRMARRLELPSTTAGRICPKGIFVRSRSDHCREEFRHDHGTRYPDCRAGKLVSRPLRLPGLGVSNLREPAGQQLALL